MNHILLLSFLLFATLSIGCDRTVNSQSAQAPAVSLPAEEREHLYDMYEGDTLVHHGYEVSRLTKSTTYAVIRKENKIVATFEGGIDHPAGRRPDKEEITVRIKEVLRNSPLYEYLYPQQALSKHFQHIDFENHSYGSYRFRHGTQIDLRLRNRKYEYNFEEVRGWFHLENIYYADLTGDGIPEAIVMLSVVQCGASCDGGATLFCVYTLRKRSLHEIWRYETGTMAYGCGLKSFSAKSKEIVMELFGRCPVQGQEDPGPGKFLIEDLTRLNFKFEGGRFLRGKIEFLSTAASDTRNYKPEVVVGSN
ncbi:MAG TPA: hypothetical protein VHH35_05850 [Pyrinomonadaceae bacterium]|nr:hypothetical protein [Pyrinomonadaceae bacterium]